MFRFRFCFRFCSTHLGLFRSLCMILCECKYCIPRAICLDQETKRDGNMTCSSFSIFCNGPYGQNSMMMQKTGDCVQTPL